MTLTEIKKWMLGSPIASHHAEHQKLNVSVGLAVFSSDALSSTAYAIDEILIPLSASTYFAAINQISMPVTIALVLLIALVVISYRQVITAYPDGGGSYIVSKHNLGETASLIAGAALLIDYVLTVAVSISSGVAQLVSTGLCGPVSPVTICVLLITAMMVANLRGLKESGTMFALPAFFFLIAMFGLIVSGLWVLQWGPPDIVLHASLMAKANQSHLVPWTDLAFLVLFFSAFSHGCSGLTGIEAVSNGVKAFKEPRSELANKTMLLMGIILSVILLGLTYLTVGFGITPQADQTIFSQISHAVFQDGWMYYVVQFSTTVILILAANTAFADFPRVTSLLAQDGFLPRQLTSLGDRLVFSNGIILLGLVAIALIIGFNADTHSLIPLYAIGVFLCFTTSQLGMVRYHQRERQPGWQQGLLINGLGALVTAAVTLLLAVEKFSDGAWIVLVLIPLLIVLFQFSKAHYLKVAKQLAMPEEMHHPVALQHTVLVLISSMNRGALPALEYAKSISSDVEAVHVELSAEATDRLKMAWDRWGSGVPLTILKSPYRSLMAPLMAYIDEVETRHEHDMVTVIVPEFVTKHWWQSIFHNQTALLIRALLRNKRNKIVTTVRYHLDE
ncbi:MAG: APC family permease [Cyanobacteria bacterium]|nr:APC family permease [Cyanobacteriota bacterium]